MKRLACVAALLVLTLAACGDDRPADEADKARAERTFNDYYTALNRGDFELVCDLLATPEGKRRMLQSKAPRDVQERVESASAEELDRSCPEIVEAGFERTGVTTDPDSPAFDYFEGVESSAHISGDEIVLELMNDGVTQTVRLTRDYKILQLYTLGDAFRNSLRPLPPLQEED